MADARSPYVEMARKLGAEVAAVHAADVDQKARFPSESINALKEQRLLSAFVPKELGGMGCSITDLHQVCLTLGQYCSSTAMIFAMHQIQVACLVRHHGASEPLKAYLKELSAKQLLLASATTELGIGGDVRSSSCAVLEEKGRFKLEKNAPVISYGKYADGILVTARKNPDAPPSDQVLVLVKKGDFTLEEKSSWDTLGMRGTCSLGFLLKAEGPMEQVLPTPYAEISSETMLPVSHIVWSSLWCGNAIDAVHRARVSVRGEARKKPGVIPPSALRLAEVQNTLQLMRANISDCVRSFEDLQGDPEALSGLGFAIKMNNLKVGSSQMAVSVVGQSLLICGISGYKNDSKSSVARNLRDAYGAALMISNERIYNHNASLLLVHKDD